jgi:multidrug resistance efflux pump
MHKIEFTAELRKKLVIYGGVAIAILLVGGGCMYGIMSSRVIAIDTASVSGPSTVLAATVGGRLNALYVQEGDTVSANAAVALVGTEVVRSKTAGLVVDTTNTIGAQIAPGAPVVTVIDPTTLRVVGRIDENKGLSRIQVGDPATFTVDAYGSRRFTGIVDAIAPSANASGVVFNISGARETQQFDVKVRFDTEAYPFLRDGMSARLSIYPQ